MSDILNFISDPAERRKLLSSTLDVLNRGVVAGTLGAPVDLMNLGINAVKAGYGYAGHKMGLLSASDMPEIDEKPVGGSEWIAEQMQKRSLLGNYRNPTAEILAGGLLAPLAGAAVQARAPQIAAGLLKAQENLAAPSTIPQRGQRGAIVYHGSPHKFDKFDSSKIGTGEGAQAYGHGLYLAESPGVAESYAKILPQRKAMDPSWWADKRLPEFLTVEEQKTLNAIKEKLHRTVYGGKNPTPDEMAVYRRLQDKYSAYNEAVEAAKPVGALYKVDLPDNLIARMLDWDKPLSQQAPEVQSIFGKSEKITGAQALKAIEANPEQYFSQTMNGRDLTGAMIRPERGSSEFLKQKGIPGIRYLDGGSRGAGSGTSNFVVFPGEESLLRILERNGQTLP